MMIAGGGLPVIQPMRSRYVRQSQLGLAVHADGC